MKRIIFILIILSCEYSFGQNQLIGVRLGSNLTNITKQRFDNNTDNRRGLNCAVSFEHMFKKNFTISSELQYSQKGFILPFIFTDDNGIATGRKEFLNYNYNYDYISIPIIGGLRYGNKLYGFLNIAITPSLLIDAKTNVPIFNSDNEVTNRQTSNVTKYVRKFDIGALTEIGVGYKLKKQYWIYSSISYQHSFTSFTNANYFSSANFWHNAITFSLGLKYSLKKKKK